MDQNILVTSAVFAALITALVNLRIAVRNASSQRDLEQLKRDIALTIKAIDASYTKVSEFRTWCASNNLLTLAQEHFNSGPDAYTNFCVHHVPTLMMDYSRQIDLIRPYLCDKRAERIDSSARSVREHMKEFAKAYDEGDNQEKMKSTSAAMLIEFAKFNDSLKDELDSALGGSGAVQKI